MDPLSALSFSAAVVQFADFGSRLLKNAHETYTSSSGQASELVELSIVSKDLANLAENVESRLTGDNEASEGIFRRLCRDCRQSHDELQDILHRLQARGSNRLAMAASSLTTALRKVAAAGEIERLSGQLSRIRQQMMAELLSSLWWVTILPGPLARKN